MWKCPVCNSNMRKGAVCSNCGFDRTMDYTSNATIAKVPKQILLNYARMRYNFLQQATIEKAENDWLKDKMKQNDRTHLGESYPFHPERNPGKVQFGQTEQETENNWLKEKTKQNDRIHLGEVKQQRSETDQRKSVERGRIAQTVTVTSDPGLPSEKKKSIGGGKWILLIAAVVILHHFYSHQEEMNVSVNFQLNYGDYEYAEIEAFDDSGKSLWNVTTEHHVATELEAVSEIGKYNGMYYYNDDGTVTALDLGTGDVKWRNGDFGGREPSFDFGEDGTLYISGAYGPSFCAIDKAGNTLAEIEEFDTVSGWPHEVKCYGDYVLVKQLTYGSNIVVTYRVNLIDFTYECDVSNVTNTIQGVWKSFSSEGNLVYFKDDSVFFFYADDFENPVYHQDGPYKISIEPFLEGLRFNVTKSTGMVAYELRHEVMVTLDYYWYDEESESWQYSGSESLVRTDKTLEDIDIVD